MSVILGYSRTPFVKINGQFASISAVDLGANAIASAIKSAGLLPEDVDVVVGGQVLQAGTGQNPVRQAAVKAGIGLTAPASTINSVCLSGTQAVITGHQLIASSQADIVVVVGQESMSLAPHAWVGSRGGKRFGSATMLDTLELDGLTDAFSGVSMGSATEIDASDAGLSREAQDIFSSDSHQRAASAKRFLSEEISPVAVSNRGKDVIVTEDDGIRPDTTVESLAKLRPAFSPNGLLTAGNSSQLTDGAAALILASENFANRSSLNPLARVKSTALVAGPTTSLLHQPANAILSALSVISRGVDEISKVEINEAFAAVGVASTKKLGLSAEQVNVHGGAIALGHPIGASGTRIVGHLARLAKEGAAGELFAAGICGGGGQGAAVVLEAI